MTVAVAAIAVMVVEAAAVDAVVVVTDAVKAAAD